MIGLSGLITPSLDQMVDVATEMERRGLSLPLLIGGATTSRQHTAVKIAPAYEHETVHVLDASRVVDVVSSLLDPGPARRRSTRENRELQERLREQHAQKLRRPLLPLARGARAPRAGRVRRPADAAVQRDADRGADARRARPVHRLAVLLPRLGPEGQVPGDPREPGRARAATTTRSPSSTRSSATARSGRAGVYGFWPAHAEGDDVVARRDAVLLPAPAGGERRRPAEPLPRRLRRARQATRSGRSPSAIHGADELAERHAAAHDDYSAIIVKALADRLAEAFAEWLHERARREWYAPGEQLSERRPARRAVPGDPARVRLPGVPRPQREGEALRAARSARRSGSS